MQGIKIRQINLYLHANFYTSFFRIVKMSSKKGARAHGKSIFNESWLSDEQFKLWLEKGPDKHKALCRLCNSVIDITVMGKSALTSHSKGNKHQINVKNFNPVSGLFFKCSSSKPSSSKNTSNKKIDLMISTLAVSHAEIRWALKVLTSHHSFRSCLNLNQLFHEMFPDSEIAKSFQLSKTKCAYYIVYGLAPYFMEILLQEVRKSPTYSILFDESLNHQRQEEQMDVQIRFWNENLYEVQTRYLTSRFFKRPNADNILHELLEATDGLPQKSMVMLSMDGPNTNWKVYENLKSHRTEKELPQIINVGSCGLHVVHGSLPDWCESNWLEVGKSFKGHVEVVQ